MLERLDVDDDGLYSDDESDSEAEGISGCMPETDDGLMADIASGEVLDDEEEESSMDADDASSYWSSSGQYL